MRPGLCVAAVAVAVACEPDVRESTRAVPTKSAETPDSALRAAGAGCFVDARSVLARAPGSPAPGPAALRGWIFLDSLAGEHGPARLVDSDGRALGASWRRSGTDSVLVTGFDDFLRVEMRLRLRGDDATGHARAHSDAAFDRDSAGGLREFRREWQVAARGAPCDSVPLATGNPAR